MRSQAQMDVDKVTDAQIDFLQPKRFKLQFQTGAPTYIETDSNIEMKRDYVMRIILADGSNFYIDRDEMAAYLNIARTKKEYCKLIVSYSPRVYIEARFNKCAAADNIGLLYHRKTCSLFKIKDFEDIVAAI